MSDAPKFIFYVHKPKASMIADWFLQGCVKQGIDCLVTEKMTPKPDRIGIFYGVVPQSYTAFRMHMAEKKAIYLDNGWTSSPERPTLRFTWNGVQSFLRDLEPWQNAPHIPALPHLVRKPQRDLALLVLQSKDYFSNMQLPYSRDVWERATTKLLTLKGYRVEVREKPTFKHTKEDSFFDQMGRAGIVVSLNSAATVKALRYGVPAYCTLDCTLSPYAPVKLPAMGLAAPPNPKEVADLCDRLSRHELTKTHMITGDAITRLMAVPPPKRIGYFYGPL